MKLVLVQINSKLGAFKSNFEKILLQAKKAAVHGCDLVVFPESALPGYHPFDLLERKNFVHQQLQYLNKLSRALPPNLFVLVGAIVANPNKKGRPWFNTAALLAKGHKPRFFHKTLLPSNDVFDEHRFFEPGDVQKNHFTLFGKKILVTICEDIWAWPDTQGRSFHSQNPLEKIKKKFDLVINLSASPYYFEKDRDRKYMAKKTATHFDCPIAYVNLVGGQDELIFDGGSFVLGRKNGNLLGQCPFFKEDSLVFDLDLKLSYRLDHGKTENKKSRQAIGRQVKTKPISKVESLKHALVLGIRDFFEKTHLKQVHLGLSGGIDSALVACLAVEAIGPERVEGFALPTQFNSEESLSCAKQLAENLKIKLKTISIDALFESTRKIVDQNFEIKDFCLVHENLQARLRALLLMAYSNKASSMLLSTSNKSEIAAGFCTLYGDMCGGLAPIGDLTKGQVFELARLYNASGEIIPKFVIDRPPSAELRPNQKDEDNLPKYKLLDSSVEKIVENCLPPKNETDSWLIQAIGKSEFKRWQSPPILKVSKHAFGRGRRYPIAGYTEY